MSNPVNHRAQQVFSFFEPTHASALIEYAKSIAKIETDFTIFMARKAARLHDLLRIAGCEMPTKPTVFSYVLEQDLARFRGKSVTLVDDTLILGSTLASAKKKLLEAGAAEVKTIVFATDKDEVADQLITPDRSFLSLSHAEVLSFCAAEVQALAAFSIPYLSDFPFFEPLRVSKLSLLNLQSLPFWETNPLTVEINEKYGVACYSILPEKPGRDILSPIFGYRISKLVDICKVRVYISRNVRSRYSAQVVPIATLQPISSDDIPKIFQSIVATFEKLSGRPMTGLEASLASRISQLRFIQYALSLGIGRAYMSDVAQYVAVRNIPDFSLSEAAKLFGPWLRPTLRASHEAVGPEFDPSKVRTTGSTKIDVAELPYSVANVSESECQEFLETAPNVSSGPTETRTLRTDLEAVFLSLHDRHELPAREEIRRLGAAVLDLPPEEAPHRDRLKFGFAWSSIVKALFKRERIRTTPKRAARLSLLLDMLIDNGVAVPILCERDGVLFRAYRHGEDVPFANQEAALCYDTLSGFIENYDSDLVPKQYLEKLLVSLIKVGISRGILVEIHSINGSVGGIVRVGYHLHGAVMSFPAGNTPLADNTDSWLSSYLTGGGVLTGKKEGYKLGSRPEASTVRTYAPDEAEQIGSLLGILAVGRTEDDKRIFSLNDFTILATCTNPRDTALAIVAELRIIFAAVGFLPSKMQRKKAENSRQLQRFLNQNFYTALNSARMKLAAFRSSRIQAIYDRCYDYLGTQPNGRFLQRQWKMQWGALLESGGNGLHEFLPWIEQLEDQLMALADCIFSMELALASAAYDEKTAAKNRSYNRTCTKIAGFLNDPALIVETTTLRDRVRALAMDSKRMDDPSKAYDFALARWRRMTGPGMVLVHQVCDFSLEYGRTVPKRTFRYCVWYDIINSTGQKSDLTGPALKAYRQRVKRFKEGITARLASLQAHARDDNVVLYPWQNTLTSKDDEKNVFISGTGCERYIEIVTKTILNEARARGVRVRILSCEANFAGTDTYKFDSDADVHGVAFWEHGSRVRAQLKEKEDASDSESSYIWLLGRLATKHRRFYDQKIWPGDQITGTIVTDIENYALESNYRGGLHKTIVGDR